MKTIKTLHLASFDGNIGDNANHNGMRRIWKDKLPVALDITELEIREFHWKRRFFDDDFVHLCNQYDLVIIGGGNYFELWVEKSRTGTSVDIPPDMLRKIRPPIFFNALGCDPYKGAPLINIQKFKAFLDVTGRSEKYFLTVRNDGSLENVRNFLGKSYGDMMTEIPDGGFFVNVIDHYHPEIIEGIPNIIINLAGDMPEIRFPGDFTCNNFVEEFSAFLMQLFEHGKKNFIFVPHIFRDLSIISRVIDLLRDDVRRRFVSVAPYLHGEKSEEYIFDLYKKVDVSLGMRFHANVCSIGLSTPSIAMITYPKIFDLCKGLGISEKGLWVNKKGFTSEFLEKTILSLEEKYNIKMKYREIREQVSVEMDKKMNLLSEWMEKNKLF